MSSLSVFERIPNFPVYRYYKIAHTFEHPNLLKSIKVSLDPDYLVEGLMQ